MKEDSAMTVLTLAPAAAPDPSGPGGAAQVVPYTVHDALVRAVLATLAADAGGHPNPLGYLRDALGGVTPRPGAHPREYVPVDEADAVWGRW
jgi:hypothetical protein